MLNRRFNYFFVPIMFAGSLFIIGCQKAVRAPSAIWQPVIEPESVALNQWLSLRQPNSSETIGDVSLWLTKVYGLTVDTAFLLGSYQFPTFTYRSVLLRTGDAGQTWQEVHQGISVATLFGIDFVDSETGFAYGQLTTGDPEPPFILRSDDGGLSWTTGGKVEAEGSPAIYAFYFTNTNYGQIKLLFHAVGTTPEANHRIETHETNDGGKTWERIASKMIGDDEANKIGDTMEPNMLHRRDSIRWRLEEAGSDAWTYGYWISQSLGNEESWQRVSRFPRYPFAPKPGELDVD